MPKNITAEPEEIISITDTPVVGRTAKLKKIATKPIVVKLAVTAALVGVVIALNHTKKSEETVEA